MLVMPYVTFTEHGFPKGRLLTKALVQQAMLAGGRAGNQGLPLVEQMGRLGPFLWKLTRLSGQSSMGMIVGWGFLGLF